ncbi:MAG: hypothetical protein WAN65_25645 [Candidatus Sulfotelmatobacter sp.]
MNIFKQGTIRQAILVMAILGVVIGRGDAAAKPAVRWPSLDDIKSGSGESLEKAGLSSAELKRVRAALNNLANGEGCQGPNIQSCDAPQSTFLAVVKITTDGRTAVILRAPGRDCGTAGCPMWVIQTSGKVLIKDFGWGYFILSSREHRYFDVVTATGNHRVGLAMWSFDGDHYRVIRCTSTEATDRQGPPPQVSEQRCPVSIQ